MTTRITVNLSRSERNALGRYAAREYREVRAQAAQFIRQALEREGYLQPEPEPIQYHRDAEEPFKLDEASGSSAIPPAPASYLVDGCETPPESGMNGIE